MELIVVGGGPAGVTAALRACELGAKVTLIERGRMGGVCTNDGCVPTRVLAKAARLLRDSAQFNEYGLTAEPPQLDFAQLMERASQVVETLHIKKQVTWQLRKAGVSVIEQAGEAFFVDPYTLALPDGRRLSAESFILCVGGRARRLDFPGQELALTHSQLWGLRVLPRSMIVVGAAATGCQLASVFNAFGTQVTLLETLPRILHAEDEAISETVQAGFVNQGIKIITGLRRIQDIQRMEGKLNLHLLDANGVPHQLTTEMVVLSAGWPGNLEALRLEAAGVQSRGNYIQVDDTLRTNVPHIFAAGDITGRMMLVQSAGSEALIAAENAVLGSQARSDHRISPHGGFTDPEYGSCGLTESQARAGNISYSAAQVHYREVDRAVIDGRPVGLCKLIVSRENHKLLGVHVAGEQALEVVHLVAAGTTSGMTVEQLADMEIAYPTFAAVVGLAARKIMHDLEMGPQAPNWRTMGMLSADESKKLSTGNDFRND